MKKNIIHYIKTNIIPLLPHKYSIMLNYYLFWKKFPNLKKPELFSEKIQWLKIYGRLDKYSEYADKINVRDYVKNTIGEKYLIPLISISNKVEDIDFNKLPNQFVIQANHGQGFNFICKNKKNININETKNLLESWLKINYYYKARELQYKYIKPKLLCSKYLEDESGNLKDYKFFCKNGNPEILQIISGPINDHKLDLYDVNLKKLPISIAYPNSNYKIVQPSKYSEMLDIAKKLSNKFFFVRVDLYLVGEKIYFGELTFTPGSGLDTITPLAGNKKLGELIDIKKYENLNSK